MRDNSIVYSIALCFIGTNGSIKSSFRH